MMIASNNIDKSMENNDNDERGRQGEESQSRRKWNVRHAYLRITDIHECQYDDVSSCQAPNRLSLLANVVFQTAILYRG
jgi:hypothetical protein